MSPIMLFSPSAGGAMRVESIRLSAVAAVQHDLCRKGKDPHKHKADGKEETLE